MKRLSPILLFTILSTALAVFPPIQEYSEEVAFTEDDLEVSSTTETTMVSDKQPIENDDITRKSEPADMIEIRQSRSPLISVYLRKIKQNSRLPTSNSTANKSEVAEDSFISPITEEKSGVIKSTGSRDDVPRPNYALIMRPQYYGSTLPNVEENLLKEEEDNKFFNLVELSSPPRKFYGPQRMRPYSRPQLNHANYFGTRPYRYPPVYGMQTGYTPQRFGYYPAQSGHVRPDYGYRLGNGPDMEENPDEEEDNKFFNLSELLSPPRKPYVPGSIRPYSNARPNYANFLGPNWRLNYGQSPEQYVSGSNPYYSGYNSNFNGYSDI